MTDPSSTPIPTPMPDEDPNIIADPTILTADQAAPDRIPHLEGPQTPGGKGL